MTSQRTTMLRLMSEEDQPISSDLVLIQQYGLCNDTELLELGCGAALTTRALAEQTPVRHIIAAEVDTRQHAKNLQITDLPKVTFKSYGAEAIDECDGSIDAIIMLKSLHHVPAEHMARAFEEMHRVLKPGGQVYISEPVYQGSFNEILRLFHDEKLVREQAFDAISHALSRGLFHHQEQLFFRNPIQMKSFQQFEDGVLNVTHTDHQLTEEMHAEVKRRFMAHQSDNGYEFDLFLRVNLLQKS